MAIPTLQNAAVGAPLTRLGVSLFPVYLPGNKLPKIMTGETSGLLVDELETPSVRTLRVSNPTDKPVLVVEGEHFLGGKQNRAVNATVLVASLSELEVPVSCLEQGRWGHRQAWRRSEAFAPARVRAAQRAGVARSVGQHGSRAGDQGAVWKEVGAMLAREEVASGTAAASDLERTYRRKSSRAAAVAELLERGPLPGQCGIAVARGSRITSLDLFGAPHLLLAHWASLVRSHYVESTPSAGRPSASRVIDLVRRFGWAHARRLPGVGLGIEHRVATGRLSGQALVLNGGAVHASFSRCAREGGIHHV